MVSYAVEPDSAVSERIQNDRVGVPVEGTVTLWLMVSVPAVPLPPSHSFHEPLWAGRPVLLVTGPLVPVQLTKPDSKPGFCSTLVPPPPPPPPPLPLQATEPAGTERASQTAAMAEHWVLLAPYRSMVAFSVELRSIG